MAAQETLSTPTRSTDPRRGSAEVAIAIEAKKASLLAKTTTLAGDMIDAGDRTTAEEFIARFYEHVPPADIVGRTPRDLFGAAISLSRLAERRRPGHAKIRIYNPDPTTDGWTSPHTIVEIVNDDMPFLVDSVSLAINTSGRNVHLVVHPILSVIRDPKGRLAKLCDPESSGLSESWMQIEITRETDRDDLARLTRTLSTVLANVRAAVEDWQPMRNRLRELLDELSNPPSPPLPSMELAEVRDFLRWLDDDNFTFLGYREYFFDVAVESGDGPFGILRDEAHPVFGGLRNLSALPSDVHGSR